MIDDDVVKDVTYSLLENGNANATGTSFITSMFPVSDVTELIHQRELRFLRDTGLMLVRTEIPTTPGEGLYNLPANSIEPRRAAWKDSTGTIRALTRADTWELDNGDPSWDANQDVPVAWYQSNLPTLRIGISQPPVDVGELEVLCVQAVLVDAIFIIPDDWVPYVKWGTMADLFSRDGEAYDPVRAAYCEQRYQEGVELARLILNG